MKNLVSVNKEKLRHILLDIDRLEYHRQEGNDSKVEEYKRMLETDIKAFIEDESVKNINWQSENESKAWKEYMLECQIVKEEVAQESFFFDTQEEMISFIKNKNKILNVKPEKIRIGSAFKLEKLNISEELLETEEKKEPKKIAKKIYNLEDVLPLKIIPKKTED